MEIKENIAKNIQELRKYKKWTQMELAEKLHYTDKAISKWERGESTPDVDALYELSQLFGVSVDYFFHKQKESKAQYVISRSLNWFKKMMWLFISDVLILLAALIVFIVGLYNGWPNIWITFIWTTPIMCFATSLFFLRIKNWLGTVISFALLPWFILLTIYLQLLLFTPYVNVPVIFFIGLPISAAVVLYGFIRLVSSKKKGE